MTSDDPETNDPNATPDPADAGANGKTPEEAGAAQEASGEPGEPKGGELGYSANLKPRPIEEELKTSFLDYSMSVIVSRAIPDVRDGLKPVQRRILYAMRDMGLGPNSPYRKSARVVGEVLGKYHPHGDSAVYDAMVRMAQDFSLRYQLVDGQGNFGSVDGDPAAAMRYTEARLAKIAHELLEDIDKETVDFTGNFDDSLEEPSVLPGRLPNLLVNGASGIAVGMATNIPPHNLTEICDAVVKMIDDPEVTVNDLMDVVKGPDFPTGGIICGSSGIYSAFLSGRGRIVVRGRTHVEERPGDREAIIVTELPYQVNKANMLVSIAELVKEKRIEGISDLRDESDRTGMRVVIELKRGAVADLILNQLYSHTQLQNNFNVLNLSLVNGQPKVLDLRETLAEYLKHREIIVRRRTEYELRKAEEKLHLLEGLIIALDNIDAVIELIRSSPDPETARTGLMERFSLSELQARAILDMRLSKLTSLEVESIKREHAEVTTFIERCKEILADRNELLKIIRDETLALKEKFGDERRTEIIEGEIDIDNEDLIPREDLLITLTKDGYIKRMSLDTYRAQNRGGKGLKGMKVKEEDQIIHLFKAHTHEWVLYFTDKGRVFKLKGYKVPAGSRQSKGKAIVNLLEGLQPDERIMTCIPMPDEAFQDEDQYMVFATRQGKVKRTALTAYRNILSSGIKAIKLEDGDQLLAVRPSGGDDVIMLATANGQACTFHGNVETLRPMGRDTTGVRGIKLRKGDEVVSLAVFHDIDLSIFERASEEEEEGEPVPVEEEEGEEAGRPYKGGGPYVLSLTENGYGKVVHLGNYRLTNRGGLGVRTLNVSKKSGKLVAVRGINGDEHVLMSSVGGMVVRTPVSQIRLTKSRAATGVIVMRMTEDDKLQAVAVLPAESVEEGPADGHLPPPDETPHIGSDEAEPDTQLPEEELRSGE